VVVVWGSLAQETSIIATATESTETRMMDFFIARILSNHRFSQISFIVSVQKLVDDIWADILPSANQKQFYCDPERGTLVVSQSLRLV
jgi:hypothetical protein